IHEKADLETLVDILGTQRQKAGRDPLFVLLPWRRRRKEITGDLLDEEAVIGLVVVERVDDIVAIAPGLRIRDVPRRPGRLTVASNVQPVASPSFTKCWGREEPIHQPLIGVS